MAAPAGLSASAVEEAGLAVCAAEGPALDAESALLEPFEELAKAEVTEELKEKVRLGRHYVGRPVADDAGPP